MSNIRGFRSADLRRSRPVRADIALAVGLVLVDGVLRAVSDASLRGNDLSTMATLGRLPMT